MGSSDEKKTYPDEFTIVDGNRERRTMEDGIIISYNLPTIYHNGEIEADLTTKYRKSIADAASVVQSLCKTVKTTPWRLLGCSMRKSSVYGSYATLLDSFDEAIIASDFKTAASVLEQIDGRGHAFPSYVSCSTRYSMEKSFAEEDDDGNIVKHDVKPLKMDDATDEFNEAASDVANLIDSIIGEYETNGFDCGDSEPKLGFVETMVSDILGSYPVEGGESNGSDEQKSGKMTLREALHEAHNAVDDADREYVDAEGSGDEAEEKANRKLIAALTEYAEQLRAYGMENSPDYDAIMAEISLMRTLE